MRLEKPRVSDDSISASAELTKRHKKTLELSKEDRGIGKPSGKPKETQKHQKEAIGDTKSQTHHMRTYRIFMTL